MEHSKDPMEEMLNKMGDIYNKVIESGAYVYRVPQEIRKGNKSAYTPRLVSIGPLHIHSMDKHLQSHMEGIKRYHVFRLLLHVADQLKNVDAQQLAQKLEGFEDVDARDLAEQLQNEDAPKPLLSICMKQMKKFWVEKAKSYYPEEANQAVTAEMLVIDGCFIIGLLHEFKEEQRKEEEEGDMQSKKKWCVDAFLWVSKCGDVGDKSSSENKKGKMGSPGSSSPPLEKPSNYDPILHHPMRRVSVLRDLLLLENQLPFFVLENLFCLTLGLLPDAKPLRGYILDCFCNRSLEIGQGCPREHDCTLPNEQNDQEVRIDVRKEGKQKCEYDHILHVVHDHYLPQHPPPKHKKKADEFMPSASVLDRAAVKFEVPDDKVTVEFVNQRGYQRARFKIRTLSICDTTEAVLRNLIAFEQCRPGVNYHYFASYAALMDGLINTEADAQVLEEAKVIQNNLGSNKDVSRLFNNLCKEVPLDDSKFLFLQEQEKAAMYNKDHRSAWFLVIGQYLQRRWSATPSTFIAFCVAILAFLMQVAGFITNYVR